VKKREFDRTDAWWFWKTTEKAGTPTRHPAKTAECLSFFQFEERRYNFAQLVHLASCSYCQKTDWMFHCTHLKFKFSALVSPAKLVVQQIGNSITEVYPEQSKQQFIHIPDTLLQCEKNVLKKKTNVRARARDDISMKNGKFLQLTPYLFASARLIVFAEVGLQNNQFDVILELRECKVHQLGQPIPNCHVTFQKARKKIADTAVHEVTARSQTSEYGICRVYGLGVGTYQVAFDGYPHVSLELELLEEVNN